MWVVPNEHAPGANWRWHDRTARAKVIAAIAVALVTGASFMPGVCKRFLHTQGRLHLWDHLAAFSLLAIVLYQAGRSRAARLRFFACGLLLGAAIEFFQHVVHHAALERADVLADHLGLCFGYAFSIASRAVPARSFTARLPALTTPRTRLH